MFYVCFTGKWCAALSSAVSSGGPKGQVAWFNANSFFKNITGPYGNDIQRNVENDNFQQDPGYFKLRLHASTDPKCSIFVFKLWGFSVNMWSKMSIFWKKSQMPQNFQKSFLGLFYMCFACKWCAALSSAVSPGGHLVCKFLQEQLQPDFLQQCSIVLAPLFFTVFAVFRYVGRGAPTVFWICRDFEKTQTNPRRGECCAPTPDAFVGAA